MIIMTITECLVVRRMTLRKTHIHPACYSDSFQNNDGDLLANEYNEHVMFTQGKCISHNPAQDIIIF